VSRPSAQVKHQSPTRLRIRIPAERGNAGYFERLRKAFDGAPGLSGVEVNAATGTVLFHGEAVDPAALQGIAAQNDLYDLSEPRGKAPGIPNRSVEPVAAMNRGIRRLTGGSIDLSGLLFFTLLGSGLVQIFRGNMGAPPWYTAFWYAFGVYTKQLMGHPPDPDDAE